MRASNGSSPGRDKPIPDIEPPSWLLAIGCAALVQLTGGRLVGGTIGAVLAVVGYLLLLTATTIFFSLLTRRLGRRKGR